MTTARYAATSPPQDPSHHGSMHYALLERRAIDATGRERAHGPDLFQQVDDDLDRLVAEYGCMTRAEITEAFAAFRSAARQHLGSCGDLRGSSTAILGPLSAEVVHDLKVRAVSARRPSAGESAVSEALASLYEAHAALGDALSRAADPGVLVVPGLPG